jgi:N-acetylglucosaminyldiphosphoundecaprenol N-acetyl-beta-D-mannosaminyltransferase
MISTSTQDHAEVMHSEGEAHRTSATIAIGPMRITALSPDELIRRLVGHTLGGATHHVVTANAQFYVMAQQDPDFRKCIAEAEYVIADGVSVVMACRWLGRQQVSRIAGVDLIPRMCAEAATIGVPVYMLGGRPGMAVAAAETLLNKYPGLRLVGIECPPIGFDSNPQSLKRVVRAIEAAKPAILFVALGAPRQEYFIQRHIRPLGIPVAIGVGGSFEMIAGAVQRAPAWIRHSGFEWAFRWAQEPRRLAKRYLAGNALFTYYLVQNRFRH